MDPAIQNDDLDENSTNLVEFNEIPINSWQTEEISDDGTSEICLKSTFKNAWQAKKRLQAFSSQKQISASPSSSKTKLKTVLVNERTYNEKGELLEALVPLRKPPKRADNPMDKARAVIEEIEFLKKIEILQSTPITAEEKFLTVSRRPRSRSKSCERDFVFRKREKKVRNYRKSDTNKRSPSPTINKVRHKPSEKITKCKYPRNWEEFTRDNWNFEKLAKTSFNLPGRSNNPLHDITRQLLLETPAEIIKPFYYKNEKGEDILVPYPFLRCTSAKPRITYNINTSKIKDYFLTREEILSKTHKNYRPFLEKFLARSTRTKFRTTEPIGQRNWYQKNWKDNESRVLETSIGLSFLQNYSDDDEEEDELCFEVPKIKEAPLEKKNDIPQTKSDSPATQHLEDVKIIKITGKEERSPESRKENKKPDPQKDESKKSLKTDDKMTENPSTSVIEEIGRNRSKSESFFEETTESTGASWTPERIIHQSEHILEEEPHKKSKEKSIQRDRKNKIDANFENLDEKQKAREIYSEDEWDETPKIKKEKVISEEVEVKKVKKKNKKKSDSDSSSTPEKKESKKKKKKLDKKKKQKEKEKKARKRKEKLKAEKLRLKKEKRKKFKEKQRETEKEILKKLKKEIEHNLQEVDREERDNRSNKLEGIIEAPIKVKIEKPDDYGDVIRPVDDLRNFLDKKVGKVKDLREKVKKKRLSENNLEELESHKVEEKKTPRKQRDIPPKKKKKSKELSNKKIKKEKQFKENKHKEEKEEFPVRRQVVDVNEFAIERLSEETNIIDNIELFNFTSEKIENGDPVIKESIPNVFEPIETKPAEVVPKPKAKSKEAVIENTPDTDEYTSNWESDEGISPIVKMAATKVDRSWESDEEVFERPYSTNNSENVSFGESPILEMPLHIKKFSRRNIDRRESTSINTRPRIHSPEYFDADSEIKLLEAERINLTKERMQLEIEKIRIHELERKKSMEEIEFSNKEAISRTWEDNDFRKKQDKKHSRWDLREDHVDSSTSKGRKEKSGETRSKTSEKGCEIVKSAETLNKTETIKKSNSVFTISSSPEITSTKSPTPTVLENAYQEFIKAVSVGDDLKEFLLISSTESEIPDSGKTPSSSISTNQRKTRLTRSERDRNREKNIGMSELKKNKESSKVLGTTDPKVLQEILLPGEVSLAEIPMPMPMPVPSPKIDVLQSLPPPTVMSVTPSFPTQELVALQEPEESPKQSPSPSKKPFSFSTLVLPAKRQLLLDKSNWKVDEDSEEEVLPPKKKLDDDKMESENTGPVSKEDTEERSTFTEEPVQKVAVLETKIEKEVEENKEVVYKKIEEKKVDKAKEGTDVKKDIEDRKKDERTSKRRHSRSRSPMDTKEKRRKEEDSRRRDEESRKRDMENRRREDFARRDEESKRRGRGKRTASPQRHREPSPRRRRLSSPSYRRSSPRYRSSPRRQESSRRSDRGSKRSPSRLSPPRRRRSYSPKHSPSTRGRSSSPRERSPRPYHYTRRSKSPGNSPMDGLKRSVADSTISDDLLPQPYMGECSNSPLSSTPASTSRRARVTISPKRPSLDERINQVLGIDVQPLVAWKQEYIQPQAMVYSGYPPQEHLSRMTPSISSVSSTPTSKVLQVGNNLQVVPTEEICLPQPIPQAPKVQKIVQVGNMLQIVPTEMELVLPPPLPPPIPPQATPAKEVTPIVPPPPEKRSAEAIMVAKNAERMAERVKKRHDKEERKKEKELKKKEKDKKRKMKLKTSTEEMIKRALELDGLIEGGDPNATVPEIISETPGLDPSKSILSTSTSRYVEDIIKNERRKSVQFADGVRPGEGTSPSAGEELSSPPPQPENLPKAKRYRKIEASKRKKRKIKVKVIKHRQPAPDSDEDYENLPPPSPPPGSPPPNVFPARVKVHTINNIPQHYLPAFGLTTAPQQPMISQPHPGINVGYQTPPPTAVYRPPPPPPPTHVMGQHYARGGHTPSMNTHMHPPPQHMHGHGSAPISHRELQQYSSF